MVEITVLRWVLNNVYKVKEIWVCILKLKWFSKLGLFGFTGTGTRLCMVGYLEDFWVLEWDIEIH